MLQHLLSSFLFFACCAALPSLYTDNSFIQFKSPGHAFRIHPTIDNNGAQDRVLLLDYVDISFTSISEVSVASCPPLTLIPLVVQSAAFASSTVSYYELDTIHTKSFQQLPNGASLNFTWTVYNQSGSVPAYPNTPYTLFHNNSLKSSFLLKNWPFQSSLNCLRVVLSVRFSSPVQSSSGIVLQLLGNLLYFLVTLLGLDITLFQGTMKDAWLDNSRLAPVTYKTNEIKQGGLLSGYVWVGNDYEFWFPSFSSSLLYDPDWSILFKGSYTCSNNCNNHGTCIKNDNCHCDSGWQGSYCSQAVCPDCHGHGTCETNPGPGQAPYCVCQGSWLGSECTIPDCPGNPDCGAHGSCDGSVDPPVCHCNPGWDGSDCLTPLCPNGCSGHGSCKDLVDPPICQCDPGWDGTDCTMLLGNPTGLAANASTTDAATTNGPTTDPLNTTTDASTTDAPTTGAATTGAATTGAATTGAATTGAATTDAATTGAATTADASTSATQATSDQSTTSPMTTAAGSTTSPSLNCENGVWNATWLKCDCFPLWVGTRCNVAICPGYNEQQRTGNCFFHGQCVNHICNCSEGWTGIDCSYAYCPSNCMDHGYCRIESTTPTCVCNDGWTGTNCSIEVTRSAQTPPGPPLEDTPAIWFNNEFSIPIVIAAATLVLVGAVALAIYLELKRRKNRQMEEMVLKGVSLTKIEKQQATP